MPKPTLAQHLSGLSNREFAALTEEADADYAEGRVAADANGWIVSETEMRLRQKLASPGSRRQRRTKKPSEA